MLGKENEATAATSAAPVVPGRELPSLVFEDGEQQEHTLSHLNMLRRSGQFCDVVLQVGSHSMKAHRAVLACASPYLFELFLANDSKADGSPALGPHCQYFQLGNIDYESFHILVGYAYTSRLEVPAALVKQVYKTAIMLKIEHAAAACSEYLVKNLSISNCLGVRSCVSNATDPQLTCHTDTFILHNIKEVIKSPEAHKLSTICVDIMGVEDEEVEHWDQLSRLVLDWSEKELVPSDGVSALTETNHVLYLCADNILRDCLEVPIEDLSNTDIIQDYKKRKQVSSKKNREKNGGRPETASRPSSRPPSRRQSFELLSNAHEKENKVIGTTLVGAKSCTSIALLEDEMCCLSITFRPMPMPVTQPEPSPGSPTSETSSPQGSPRASFSNCKPYSLRPLAHMSSPRCGVGTAVLDGKLIVMGGYDRGECLNTMECYEPETNCWVPMPSMLSGRGRFDVSQLQGKLFACGGSDGCQELKSVECFDPVKNKWFALPSMISTKSGPGVGFVAGQLYVVGGWSGCVPVSVCEAYDPNTETWTPISPLNEARSQAAVCVLDGVLLVAGGCDAWNCLHSVEQYDPATDRWIFMPPMNTARRGSGAVVFKDKLYVVGGSDGQSSLSTVEIFDPVSKSWSFGPSLRIPRANVGVSVVGKRLFAVGGFSGKTFLDTTEYLGADETEWSNFMPADANTIKEGCSAKIITSSVLNGHMEEEIPEEVLVVNGHVNRDACISEEKMAMNENEAASAENGDVFPPTVNGHDQEE